MARAVRAGVLDRDLRGDLLVVARRPHGAESPEACEDDARIEVALIVDRVELSLGVQQWCVGEERGPAAVPVPPREHPDAVEVGGDGVCDVLPGEARFSKERRERLLVEGGIALGADQVVGGQRGIDDDRGVLALDDPRRRGGADLAGVRPHRLGPRHVRHVIGGQSERLGGEVDVGITDPSESHCADVDSEDGHQSRKFVNWRGTPKSPSLQLGDHRLQVVSLLAPDAQLVTLGLALDALEAEILDELVQLARLVAGDARVERDRLAHRAAGGLLDLAVLEAPSSRPHA